MFIIETNGEQQIVKSLDGCADYTLIGETETPPAMHEKWDKAKGRFVKDVTLEKQAERKRMVRSPESLLDRIEALEAEMAELKRSK